MVAYIAAKGEQVTTKDMSINIATMTFRLDALGGTAFY